MTPERFIELAHAWGADLRRWPVAERAPAEALVAQRRPELLQALAEAGALDQLLDAHAIAAPEAALVQRVLAGAPARRAGGAPVRRWWWWGAGAAGVGFAGAAAGALAASVAMSTLLPASRAATDLAYAATAFGSAPSERSDE